MVKARDWQVVMMLNHTKPGSHGDSKKKRSKTKARKKVDPRKEGY